MNLTVAPGKIRGLQAVSSSAGVFRILAVDHRAALLRPTGSPGTETVSESHVTRLKLDIVRHLGPLATAVILDATHSLVPAIVEGALPGSVGLIARIDGAAAGARARDETTAFSVADARLIGANAVKLLISYDGDSSVDAEAKETFVSTVIEHCAKASLPLFLEALLEIDSPSPSAPAARDWRHAMVDMVARLGRLGPDVLKLQFPVRPGSQANEDLWREACGEVTAASRVPWALLSGGAPFELFTRQLRVACEAGCSGFAAGRSIWSDTRMVPACRCDAVLRETAIPRMEQLCRIADEYGHGWLGRYASRRTDDRSSDAGGKAAHR